MSVQSGDKLFFIFDIGDLYFLSFFLAKVLSIFFFFKDHTLSLLYSQLSFLKNAFLLFPYLYLIWLILLFF